MPQANFPQELLALRQCQKCYIPESELKTQGRVLLVCGGCKKAVYCTKECQKSDWSYHKTFCKLNRGFREILRSEAEEDLVEGYSPREMEHRLRNWIEYNRPELQDAAVHALKLVENTDNLSTHLLLVSLKPAFKPREKHIEPRKAFSIQVMEPARMEEFLPDHGEHKVAIEALKQKGREIKKQGHVGLVMMTIMVTAPITIRHMSPFGLPSLEYYKPRDPNWRKKFFQTASATPNFMLPISEHCDLYGENESRY